MNNIIKSIKILLILILFTNNLYSNQNSIKLSTEEKLYLKNKKTIKMCVDPDWMPLEKIDKDKYIGISSDYIKYFEKSINIPIVLVKTQSWSKSLDYVRKRKCDILPLALETNKRKKYLNFTKKYIIMPLAISTNINKSFIYNFNSIGQNKKIGIVSGYAYKELIKNKYTNLNIVDVTSLRDGLEKVESGELYGMVDIVSVLAYNIQKNYQGILKITGTFDEDYGLSVGVRNDDLILLNIYNKAIKNIDKQLQQKILNKWISVKYENEINYTIIFNILFISSIIMIFIIYRQYILKKTNIKLIKLVEQEVKKNKEKDRVINAQSKNAAMGEMLSLITHQWRQPLNELGLVLQKFKYAQERDKLTKELIIEQTELGNNLIHKMSTTIDDFKNFLLPNKENSFFSVSKSIENMIKLLNASYKYNNIIILMKLNSIKNIKGNKGEFEQVLLNILNNALDAFETIDEESKYINITARLDKEYLYLLVEDNAGGVKEEYLGKLFEPYFSTKGKNGTGLGLYMSQMIIQKQFQGDIDVESSQNRTTFSIKILRD